MDKNMMDNQPRQSRILNILLIMTCGIFSYLLIGSLSNRIILHNQEERGFGESPLAIILATGFFYGLLFISKRGAHKTASFLLIGSLFITALYILLAWGAIMPLGLLFLTLAIIMSGILINSNASLCLSCIASISLIIISYLQINNLKSPNLYWLEGSLITYKDAIIHIFVFGAITLISWLFNGETEQALNRAKISETELKKERDSLEKTVLLRTEQIKKAQLEQISQLYRFAKFGKLSSGIFHDLINPLTALALNLEQVKKQKNSYLHAAQDNLNQAMEATKKMADFIGSLKKQISRQECLENFLVVEEIKQILSIIKYKALKNQVEFLINCEGSPSLYGDSIKFNQIIMNLASNSIDAYSSQKKLLNKKIEINCKESKENLIISVKDWAGGIDKKIENKIFQPFFTTKDFSSGLGLGLASSKAIIQNCFSGDIVLKNKPNIGSEFIISIPKINPRLSS